jgi:hypothetical protein
MSIARNNRQEHLDLVAKLFDPSAPLGTAHLINAGDTRNACRILVVDPLEKQRLRQDGPMYLTGRV